MLDDLVRSEYDPVIGLVGTLIIAVCIMQELDYGRTGNNAAGKGETVRFQLV